MWVVNYAAPGVAIAGIGMTYYALMRQEINLERQDQDYTNYVLDIMAKTDENSNNLVKASHSLLALTNAGSSGDFRGREGAQFQIFRSKSTNGKRVSLKGTTIGGTETFYDNVARNTISRYTNNPTLSLTSSYTYLKSKFDNLLHDQGNSDGLNAAILSPPKNRFTDQQLRNVEYALSMTRVMSRGSRSNCHGDEEEYQNALVPMSTTSSIPFKSASTSNHGIQPSINPYQSKEGYRASPNGDRIPVSFPPHPLPGDELFNQAKQRTWCPSSKAPPLPYYPEHVSEILELDDQDIGCGRILVEKRESKTNILDVFSEDEHMCGTFDIEDHIEVMDNEDVLPTSVPPDSGSESIVTVIDNNADFPPENTDSILSNTNIPPPLLPRSSSDLCLLSRWGKGQSKGFRKRAKSLPRSSPCSGSKACEPCFGGRECESCSSPNAYEPCFPSNTYEPCIGPNGCESHPNENAPKDDNEAIPPELKEMNELFQKGREEGRETEREMSEESLLNSSNTSSMTDSRTSSSSSSSSMEMSSSIHRADTGESAQFLLVPPILTESFGSTCLEIPATYPSSTSFRTDGSKPGSKSCNYLQLHELAVEDILNKSGDYDEGNSVKVRTRSLPDVLGKDERYGLVLTEETGTIEKKIRKAQGYHLGNLTILGHVRLVLSKLEHVELEPIHLVLSALFALMLWLFFHYFTSLLGPRKALHSWHW